MPKGTALDIQFQKRFSRNLLSNIIYFILSIIVGLALVPYFLDTLGPSAYGLVPLATSLTSYITLFIDGVNEAISRYLTLDLQRGDLDRATCTYNTALLGTLGILVLMIPIGIAAAFLSPTFFDIGEANPADVILMFGLVIGSVFVRAWSSNFMVILFAHNRLDLRNRINIVNLLVQIPAVILLFVLFGPKLQFVGLSYLISAFASLACAIYLSKRAAPDLRVVPKSFSFPHLKEMVGTSLWIVLAKLGVVLRAQIALILVNIFVGTLAGTDYSLVLTWFTLITSIIGLVTSCFVPMSYAYRARDDKEGLINFTKMTVKVVTLATALLVGLVCIFAGQLMTIWVGEEYARLAPLMWIILIGCIFAVQSSCCSAINAAYLRVQFPAFANIVCGTLNIIIAIVLCNFTDWGIYGIAFATTATTAILSGILSPGQGAYILEKPLYTFIKAAVPGYLAFIILSALGIGITNVITIDGILPVCAAGIIILILYCAIVWYLVLKKEERKIIINIIPGPIQKKIPIWIKRM